MRILILGGSGFVGRATAELAVARGHDVTVFNRGRRDPVAHVTTLTGDRLATGGLDALRDGAWDTVIDTWSAGAAAVGAAAALLSGRATNFVYVSSRSVYRWDLDAPPLAEDSPLADVDDPGYAGDKLRAEIATAAFDGPVLLARAGLILGPYEDIGRLPWWLGRLHTGGPTLAPGPRDLALQYIDVRDLAAFLLDAAGRHGPFNVVSPPGHTTMGELLDIANEVTGAHADLRWLPGEDIAAAGVQPWTQLPIWLTPETGYAFMHQGDVGKALAAGLSCRPARDTVTDTWTWLQTLPGGAPQRTDRPQPGLDPQIEAKLLGI
ncbi:nucleoside-diphosphate-sugar epimerase [Actinoplanes campanulatus]|uniref:Nucleoside-diphosphate-sugar epimerase n=1 Tax=Actinoplanes campanulatus TaxID=113559 RepID=A0A7W5FH96_9ACTN|nr:NAD-dependent epimerase/dehydratase family protein [Actinoplanes campanulatus]MBB3098453.1 nucleoside-diphosphate-sugar epimerase [Actinoplanes campanulatus]GGN35292.1 reductase [Actinoplanes campanulatus]GID39145.1 reductase [Actinoplanes campanulatus]